MLGLLATGIAIYAGGDHMDRNDREKQLLAEVKSLRDELWLAERRREIKAEQAQDYETRKNQAIKARLPRWPQDKDKIKSMLNVEPRSEEHKSEHQSLMSTSSDV